MKYLLFLTLAIAPVLSHATAGQVVADCVRADSADSPELTVYQISDEEGVLSLSDPNSMAPSYSVKQGISVNDYSITFRGELSAVVPTEGEGAEYDQKVTLSFEKNNPPLKAWFAANTNFPDVENLTSIDFVCKN